MEFGLVHRKIIEERKIMEIHDMDRHEERIKKYAVRLYDQVEVGSGFLFVPQGSGYVYIFTVLHVVINILTKIGKDLTIDWDENHVVCKGWEVEYCTLYSELAEENLIQKTAEEIKEIVYNIDEEVRSSQNKKRNKDVAVLRILKNKFSQDSVFEKPLYCIEEERFQHNFPFLGFGFPNAKDYTIKLEGNSVKWNKKSQLRDCKAVDMGQDFVDQMKGFSGTGLVTDYHGRLILTGLVVSCDSNEKHQCFRSVGMSEILLKMKAKGWQVPDIFGRGVPPDDFLDKVSYFEEDLKYMDSPVKTGLKRVFLEIDKDNKLTDLASKESFYDIPICTDERIACPIYWKGRYWLIYIYKVIRELIGEDNRISINGQELKIEYICTEGNGKADICTVVASAIKKNILGYQIKGNCILLWQSEKSPDRRIFQRRKFKNIVENIADGNKYGMNDKLEKAGFDLLTGEMKTKNYGIFHIKYLLEQLDNCQTMEEADDKVREVLEYVWK